MSNPDQGVLHRLERDVEEGLASEAVQFTLAPPIESQIEAADSSTNLPSTPKRVNAPSTAAPSTTATATASREPTIRDKATPSPPMQSVSANVHARDPGSLLTVPQKELPGGSPELATLALGHAESQAGSKEATPETNDANSGLLTGARLFLVFLALMLAVFVSAAPPSRHSSLT